MENNSLLRTDKEFSELFNRNMDMVYRICYMLLKNHADTEDAVQTVFLKYIGCTVSFHNVEHEKAWFIVTAKNCCRDMLKSFWRRQRVDMQTLPDIPTWDKDDSEELLTKLLSLPEKYKIVLYLYYYEDYSVKDISRLLKRNESTIRTQLSKGRERLKIDLGGNYIGK